MCATFCERGKQISVIGADDDNGFKFFFISDFHVRWVVEMSKTRDDDDDGNVMIWLYV